MDNDPQTSSTVSETPPSNPDEQSRAPVQTRSSFLANEFDLTAAGALASAALMLGLCMTCNMGMYCLPFAPLLLGILGVVLAPRALNPERARTFSWISIGVGAFLMVLLAVFVVLYIGLIVFMISTGKTFD